MSLLEFFLDGPSWGICRNCGTPDHADFEHSAWANQPCPNPRIPREEWRQKVLERVRLTAENSRR